METSRQPDDDQNLQTFVDVLQEGYYHGLLKKLKGQEWEDYLERRRQEAGEKATGVLDANGNQ